MPVEPQIPRESRDQRAPKSRTLALALIIVGLILWALEMKISPTSVGVFVFVAPAFLVLLLAKPERRTTMALRLLLLAAIFTIGCVVATPDMALRWGRVPAIVGIQMSVVLPLIWITTLSGRFEHRGARFAIAVVPAVVFLPILMYSMSVHRAQGTVTREDRDIEWSTQEIDFYGPGDTRLVGRWFPHPNPTGAVLLVHGIGAEKLQFLPSLRPLHDLGYEIMTFDQRNHGESDGLTTTLGVVERDDVVRAWNVLLEMTSGRKVTRLLFGISIGGTAAQLAVPKLDELDGLILDSTLADVADVAARQLPIIGGLSVAMLHGLGIDVLVSGQPSLGVSPIDAIRAADTRPVLLLHGKNDPLIPFEHAVRLAARYGSRARLVALAGRGHAIGFYEDPTTYADALRRFATRSSQH